MEKPIRLIQQSCDKGCCEYVRFSDDFETPVEDFLYRPGMFSPHECTLDLDIIIEMDLPDMFPMNTDLKNSF